MIVSVQELRSQWFPTYMLSAFELLQFPLSTQRNHHVSHLCAPTHLRSSPLLAFTSGGNRLVVCTRERLHLEHSTCGLAEHQHLSSVLRKPVRSPNMWLLSLSDDGMFCQLPINWRVGQKLETVSVSRGTTSPHAPQLRFLALHTPTKYS